MIKKTDIILIISLCVFAACFLWIFNFSAHTGGRVVVRRAGALYKELPLAADTALAIFSEEGGHTNTIEISGGTAKMTYAACPDGLCLKQGRIQYTNETIVCLPNRVTVEIIDGKKSAFDGIAK